MTCWYHHWTPGGGGGTESHWLQYLLYETLTEMVPGKNQTLVPPFSDAEIFPWMKKEHVTCWYHHWIPGGVTESQWLRYLLYETLTEVVPGPNQTLDPPFSDAEIFPSVKKENVTC